MGGGPGITVGPAPGALGGPGLMALPLARGARACVGVRCACRRVFRARECLLRCACVLRACVHLSLCMIIGAGTGRRGP
eukprot:8012404-Alexandrium_andersonii.AAC.1